MGYRKQRKIKEKKPKIEYRPDKKVRITKGLFAGEIGKLDEVYRDGRHFKLVGRNGWYSEDMLEEVK